MKEERLKIDFNLAFWTLLIAVNLFALAASWYVNDSTTYRYCAIMLLYCVTGAYLSLPKDKKK
jgi:hypothetical protein